MPSWLINVAWYAWAGLAGGFPRSPFASAAGITLAGAALPVDRGGAGTQTATVAAVQGDVPHARNLRGQLRAAAVTANHAAAAEQLAVQARAGSRPVPDLVIWPENSADLDPA